jgi:hypothetical protein
VVDSVSLQTIGYASSGIQPVETAAQASALPPSAPAPASGVQDPAPAAKPAASASGPSLVLDFSHGASSGYVLDWRDPSSNQVLVQIPMRSALAQLAGAPDQTGKHVNTEA